MKTVSRMVRRYVLSALGFIVLVFTVNVALFLGVIIHYGMQRQAAGNLSVEDLAASFTQSAGGELRPDGALNWRGRFCWAMLLDENGEILWSEELPEALHHRYTVPEVASFSRWYLGDYPVMAYRNDYGLLVAGLPEGSMTRFNYYLDNDILKTLLRGFVPMLLLDAALLLTLCLLLGWWAAKPLRALARGIECLARGETVSLREKGATAELAEKLNQTSRCLQQQHEQIARRDTARTNWIAGVSHDIRTPLALILGYAQQLERLAPAGSSQQEKAVQIRVQSQKIQTLIEELNLTSKLQYNTQPLRIEPVLAGPWLRRRAAEFGNGIGEHCEISLEITEAAGQARLAIDPVLMARALDNLLNNSARHNAGRCSVTLCAFVEKAQFVLVVRDDGTGFPERVLASLNAAPPQSDPNAPHILGLHLVRQIVQAHGGETVFQNAHGALARISLPLAEGSAARPAAQSTGKSVDNPVSASI